MDKQELKEMLISIRNGADITPILESLWSQIVTLEKDFLDERERARLLEDQNEKLSRSLKEKLR